MFNRILSSCTPLISTAFPRPPSRPGKETSAVNLNLPPYLAPPTCPLPPPYRTLVPLSSFSSSHGKQPLLNYLGLKNKGYYSRFHAPCVPGVSDFQLLQPPKQQQGHVPAIASLRSATSGSPVPPLYRSASRTERFVEVIPNPERWQRGSRPS